MDTGKELFRQYIKSYETGSLDRVKEFLHPSHLYHPPGGAKPMGLKARLDDGRFFLSAFTGIGTTVDDLVEEDDTVAGRVTMRCTHTGDYQGVPATGRRIVITYMDFARLKDVRIFEEWAEFDLMSIVGQLQ
jgi:predicted ester cyclase